MSGIVRARIPALDELTLPVRQVGDQVGNQVGNRLLTRGRLANGPRRLGSQ
jgi:hypothetical protein